MQNGATFKVASTKKSYSIFLHYFLFFLLFCTEFHKTDERTIPNIKRISQICPKIICVSPSLKLEERNDRDLSNLKSVLDINSSFKKELKLLDLFQTKYFKYRNEIN
ncbi:hypothetical protein BpHYR1_004004 [Brachionus plicatilis]|uniref:Uncharacterized protein n=1 Tax=Brachionus plicatilis TaxID=10195 RepID=A0A3M7T0X0_BRAPC|nr:hypothetical protein BpHYR1_004004 [Brachionus plicatilis]